MKSFVAATALAAAVGPLRANAQFCLDETSIATFPAIPTAAEGMVVFNSFSTNTTGAITTSVAVDGNMEQRQLIISVRPDSNVAAGALAADPACDFPITSSSDLTIPSTCFTGLNPSTANAGAVETAGASVFLGVGGYKACATQLTGAAWSGTGDGDGYNVTTDHPSPEFWRKADLTFTQYLNNNELVVDYDLDLESFNNLFDPFADTNLQVVIRYDLTQPTVRYCNDASGYPKAFGDCQQVNVLDSSSTIPRIDDGNLLLEFTLSADDCALLNAEPDAYFSVIQYVVNTGATEVGWEFDADDSNACVIYASTTDELRENTAVSFTFKVQTPIPVASLNAYEATLTEIGGTANKGAFYVWATGDDSYTSVTYAGSFTDIPTDNPTGDCSRPNACGIHIHSGTSCADSAAQGGHFFTGSVTADPWGPIKYSDDAGAEGSNTDNTASIAAQTLDIGTGAIEGLVAVLHNKEGGRIACGVLTKKSSYIANVAASNGNLDDTSATVAAMTTSNGDVFIVGGGADFEANLGSTQCDANNDCGYHVHTGYGCADGDAQGGHYFASATDPWLQVRYSGTDASGYAREFKSLTAARTQNIEGRAVVFHNAAAGRVACGTLAPKNIVQLPIASLNAYEATLEAISDGTTPMGTFVVWATGDDSYTSVTYAGSFTGIPTPGDCSNPNACGIHIHSGTSCTDSTTQGGHFFTGSVTADPWGPIKYSDDAGAEGSNTDNTASIAAQTLDIGTGDIGGLVAVLHNKEGGRIACGVLTKKSSYIANVAASNGNPDDTSATVAAMTTSDGEVFIVGSGAGFESNLDSTVCESNNDCGYHVHTGDSCFDNIAQGGHYFASTTDPWVAVRYSDTDVSGSAAFSSFTAAATSDINGRAVVFHNKDAGRIACGTLAPKNIVQLPIASLNAYEATLEAMSDGTTPMGTFVVWATGDDSYTSVTYAGSFTDIPTPGDCSNPNACGIHIHSGTSCTDSTTQGGHFFTGSVTADPWGPVKYSDDAGAEGSNTDNTASIAAQTLDIGTGDIGGLVAVLHNKEGGRIACGVLTKKSSYIANVAASNGNPDDTSATVAAMTTSDGEVFIVGSGAGFESNLDSTVCESNNDCGYHVHTGYSCFDNIAQGGHYFASTTDPWVAVRYSDTDVSGSAYFSSFTAAETSDINGRAVVFHNKDAGRIACGTLTPKNIVQLPIASLNAYEATLEAISDGTTPMGTFVVWATGDDSYTSVTYAGSFTGLTADVSDCSATNGCGIHIHSGNGCADNTAQGGHFFTGSVTADPWIPIKHSGTDANGAASIASETLDIGTGDIEGLVAVLHDEAGGRVACGVLTKKSSYIANVAASNGNAGAESATVAAMATSDGEVFIVGSGAGFEANLGPTQCDANNDCGYHVHTGYSCFDNAAQGGHYFASATDPWLQVRYSLTDVSGSAYFSSLTAAETPDINGRAVVFHNQVAGRIACGRLIAKTTRRMLSEQSMLPVARYLQSDTEEVAGNVVGAERTDTFYFRVSVNTNIEQPLAGESATENEGEKGMSREMMVVIIVGCVTLAIVTATCAGVALFIVRMKQNRVGADTVMRVVSSRASRMLGINVPDVPKSEVQMKEAWAVIEASA